jgi:hypothetical protein
MFKMSFASIATHIGCILLNVGAFAIFLTTFFFTLGTWIERGAVESQVNMIIDQGLNGVVAEILRAGSGPQVRQIIKDVQLPDMSEADEDVAQRNASLMATAFLVTIPAGVLMMAVGIGTIGVASGKVKEIFRSMSMTAIMIVSVFSVELAFASLVSKNYKTTPTSWVLGQVVDGLLQARAE